MSTTFAQLGVPDSITRALEAHGIIEPFAIQAATITDALGNVATDTVMVTVSNTTPTVSITNPIDGATFASGATVNFAGTASDTEDGDISSLIVWTSNLLPGLSATGANLSTNLLIDGTHIITAIITDSTGNPAIDTITITVRP